MEALIIVILFILLFVGILFSFVNVRRKNKGWGVALFELVCILAYLFSLLSLVLTLFFYSADYNEEIDPMDNGYTPFASKHFFTLFVFYVLSVTSGFLLWIKGRRLPPLLFVISTVFLIIGIFISLVVAFQLSDNRMGYLYEDEGEISLAIISPLIYIFLAIIIIVKITKEESEASVDREYKNTVLNYLNKSLANRSLNSFWVIVLLFPVFAVVVIILTLFGQESDSIVKVFTETTTWKFSQMEHPPFLDHQGHYLCTVAACGHPQIVKPVRMGMRHNHPVIVNRQLMIANAFEEKIAEIVPSVHRFIRHNYDKYGLPVSKHINTPLRSDIVYIFMKPLEWMFLFVLYLSDMKPEERIKKQYSNQ